MVPTKICVLFFTTVVLIFFSYQFLSDYQIVIQYDYPLGKNGVRYILYWDKMWTYEDFGLGLGSQIFENCEVKNCFATNDKNLLPLEAFDALIIHGVTYRESRKTIPPRRNPEQVYIYYSLESPFNTPKHLSFSKWFFNWTMSYR